MSSVSKYYGSSLVFDNLNFNVNPREIVAITGPSGSGKTSLLQIAGLIDRSNKGNVYIMGSEYGQASEKQRLLIRREMLGFVYQFHHLLYECSVLENVMLAKIISGDNVQNSKKSAEDILCDLGLKDKINSFPSQLSVGEKQRVAIARALVKKPKLLLADEPTGNLDCNSATIVFENFVNIAQELGSAVVFVTHNQELANKSHVIFEMQNGSLTRV